MRQPTDIPAPASVAVRIFGDWEGGVEGYHRDGIWWLSREGPDLQVTVTGWEYLTDVD